MIYLLGGYMWLYVHRPFEVWPILGIMQLERVYMILMLIFWAAAARKSWLSNRLYLALGGFTLILGAAWLTSPVMDIGADTIENYLKVAVFFMLVVTSVDRKSTR